MDTNQAPPQGFTPGQGGGFQGGNFPRGQFPGGGRGGAMRSQFFLGPYTGWILIGIIVLTYVVMAISFWQFLRKAGLTPAIALAMLVPVVNLGVALWVAFTQWPVLQELARLKEANVAHELRLAQEAARSGISAPAVIS